MSELKLNETPEVEAEEIQAATPAETAEVPAPEASEAETAPEAEAAEAPEEEAPETDAEPAGDEEKPAKEKKEKKPKKAKKKKKGGSLFWRIVRRFLLVLLTLVVMLVGGLYVVLDQIFNGPSPAARDVLTMTLTEASATKWVPGLFLGDELVAEIRARANVELPADVTDTNLVTIDKEGMSSNSDEWANYPDGIRIERVSGDTYNAHIMIIRDPSTVYMSCANNGNFSRSTPGARITEQIELEGAVAAINAGAFFDNGQASLEVGSTPEGLLIAGGVVEWTAGEPPKGAGGFVGFTEDDILVVAKDMTAEEAQNLGIRDGCEFGPVLIMNGEVNQEAYNSNSGYNPRTCIGQRADGAVVFVCIDGRQAGSVGGTYRDCIDILWEYGCVNACNLDGGSSSIMLYRDTYGLYGEAGTVQMINNYSLLQENPRRMPSFWMVRPAEEE